jgi:phosphoserine phosphatase
LIREWKRALLPERVVMMGDGVSDLETMEEVDMFVGFGGVVERERVRAGADHWVAGAMDVARLLEIIDGSPARMI